jgi:CotS family spore coat protein
LEDLNKIISSNYDLDVEDIIKVKNAYRIKTTGGFKCFKISKYDFNQFQFIIRCLEYLKSSGFKSILDFDKTNCDEKYIKLQEGYGFLCPWIDSREADFENPVELKMCIDTLGCLHRSSKDFPIVDIPKCRLVFKRWIEKFKKRCDELIYFKALIASRERITEFDGMYLKHFDTHYRQALKAVKHLEESKYFEIMDRTIKTSCICHHDTANHNFLITPELDMYMIDFDYCIIDSYLHDLSSIIIRCLKYGHWSFDTFNFIIDIYSQNTKINEEDLYMIFCFMEFPQDFWQVGLQYYVEKQSWSEEFFVKKLHRITEDSKDRMDYIEEFQLSILEG